MAYFPYSIMPLTPKQTPPEGNPSTDRLRITADQYNMHDEEIRALQIYLGTFDKTGKIRTGLLADIDNIVDQINTLCVEGITSSSGAAQSGQLMTFPEDATVTYLRGNLSQNGTTIDVASTNGFPQKGVISILNDISQGVANKDGTAFTTLKGETSIVEWIRYEGKTPTSFINCQRGFLGTTNGTHSGRFENSNFPIPKEGIENKQDQCLDIQGFPHEVCQFRYQGFRNSSLYSCPILNLIGSLSYIEDSIRLRPNAINVKTGTEAASVFIATANQLKILGTRSDGSLYLLSSDATYRNLDQLSPSEAYGWVQLAITNKLVQLNKTATDFQWPDNAVPVFCGKLSAQISLGALNGAQDDDVNGVLNFDSALLCLGADGIVCCYPNSKRNGPQSESFYSLIYYNILLIPSVRTSEERNN